MEGSLVPCILSPATAGATSSNLSKTAQKLHWVFGPLFLLLEAVLDYHFSGS